MKFSVKINGCDFLEFHQEDPVKASELLNLLTQASSECEPKKPDIDVFGGSKSGTVEHVLESMRGTKTASFINILANLEGFGATDVVIKQKMPGGRDVNLAPYIASISKACKRSNLAFSELLIRKEKRFRAGKVLYHYQLTDSAAEYVNSIDDFEKDEFFEQDLFEQNKPEPKSDDGPKSVGNERSVTTGSNRSRVRSAAKGITIKRIVELTGLTKSQVRAVVNANGEKENYSKKLRHSGENEYTYTGDE